MADQPFGGHSYFFSAILPAIVGPFASLRPILFPNPKDPRTVQLENHQGNKVTIFGNKNSDGQVLTTSSIQITPRNSEVGTMEFTFDGGLPRRLDIPEVGSILIQWNAQATGGTFTVKPSSGASETRFDFSI